MYLSTPYYRVVAIDATTGKEAWTFQLPSGNRRPAVSRTWPGDAKTPPQIVFGSSDAKLYSLDAKTGKPNEAFGDKGAWINTPEILQGLPGRDGFSLSAHRLQEPRDHRRHDAGESAERTGRRRPRVGHAHGEAGLDVPSVPRAGDTVDTWAGDSWKNRSGVNVWGFLTVDASRGIVYMPFGAPSVDQYGGDRQGDNLFGNSIVAADANTGKYLWHFQVVHHDLWDAIWRDRRPSSTSSRVARRSRRSPSSVRSACCSCWIASPASRFTAWKSARFPRAKLPLERVSKTQPFPIKPAPLSRMTIAATDIATVTPELEAACKKLIEGVQLGGPYLPVSYNRLRVQFPGNHGGVNWGGTSFNPQLGYLFVNTNELGQLSGLRDRDPNSTEPARGDGQGNRVDPNGPYQGFPGGGRFSSRDESPQQLPCQQPPWGNLTAVNVNTGEFAWRVPLGVTDSLPPEKQKTGRPGNGGTIATAGGLVFVGATDDSRFRAFDAKTGKELWTFKLPAAAQATPMTYEGRDGKQYVVIASTGGGFFGNPVDSDSILAFALK